MARRSNAFPPPPLRRAASTSWASTWWRKNFIALKQIPITLNHAMSVIPGERGIAARGKGTQVAPP